MIGVNLGEPREMVETWARKLAITFPLLLDDLGDTPRLFGLWAHPHTVLIDRQGRVVGLARGERDWQSQAARRLVKHLLESGR